ncbi:hypothetical protein [uncultured Rhodospira sp.]|nr:hypothetical protein [uncultured Rhodospira sp.]
MTRTFALSRLRQGLTDQSDGVVGLAFRARVVAPGALLVGTA